MRTIGRAATHLAAKFAWSYSYELPKERCELTLTLEATSICNISKRDAWLREQLLSTVDPAVSDLARIERAQIKLVGYHSHPALAGEVAV